MDAYLLRPNPNGKGWDVVRNAPTVVAESLKLTEAQALVFAMNEQVRQMENAE